MTKVVWLCDHVTLIHDVFLNFVLLFLFGHLLPELSEEWLSVLRQTSKGMPLIDTWCVFEFNVFYWPPTFSIEHFLDPFTPKNNACLLIIHHWALILMLLTRGGNVWHNPWTDRNPTQNKRVRVDYKCVSGQKKVDPL